MTNNLRKYLILAILLVGLIPQPKQLFDYKCRTFYSAFLRITLNYEDCSGGESTNVTIVTVPGFLDGRARIIPILILRFAHPDIAGGYIAMPKFLFKRNATIEFRLSPTLQIYWDND